MSAIIPLFLMWLANQQGSRTATRSAPAAAARRAKKKKPKPPRWPTTKSPPPIPAFQPAQPSAAAAPKPSADPSASSTPLAELHNNPPALAPASITEPAKQAVISTFKKKSAALLKQKFGANLFGRSAPSVPTSTALVSQLQTILNRHGAKLVQDGLYGPRTATAWQRAASARKLPTMIVREGPKIAKVASQTFEALSAAPIP